MSPACSSRSASRCSRYERTCADIERFRRGPKPQPKKLKGAKKEARRLALARIERHLQELRDKGKLAELTKLTPSKVVVAISEQLTLDCEPYAEEVRGWFVFFHCSFYVCFAYP